MTLVCTHHQDPMLLPVEVYDEAGFQLALDETRHLLDDSLPPLDAVIHGARVRLHTANAHWRRFWTANWFAPEGWASLTGQSPPETARIHIYAGITAAQAPPRAGYNLEHNTAFLIGDVPYGPLRALALRGVARLLAEEEAAHFVPGFCLVDEDQGALLLCPPGADPAGVVALLGERERAHLLTWGGTVVRYGLVRLVDGVVLLPTMVIDEKGAQVYGHRLFPWLDEYGYWEPRADARCLTLDGAEEYCFARDLDLGRAPEAFAYPLEQNWYVPTHIVAAQPALFDVLWNAPLENVPPLTPKLLDRFGPWAQEAIDAFVCALTEQIGRTQAVEAMCRLRAAPQGRAMVAPAHLWPGRAGGHPGRPPQIKRVEIMRDEGPVRLGLSELPSRLSDTFSEWLVVDEDEIAGTFAKLLKSAL